MKELLKYRKTAITYLKSRISYFTEEVDELLDSALRNISNLEAKPKDHDNYNGILGMKPLRDQQELCINLLYIRVLKSKEVVQSDYLIDEAIRVLNNLPKRPENRKPYEGLFKLPESQTNTSNSNNKKSSSQFNINELKVNQKGIDLIHSFESCVLVGYKDPGSNSGLPITIG